jgi:hypothetical protein
MIDCMLLLRLKVQIKCCEFWVSHALMFVEAPAQHSSPAKNKDSALGGSTMQNGI